MTTLTASLPTRRRVPIAFRLLAAPATAGIVVAGLWLTGGRITNDFALAMWLTATWMALAGAAALAVAVRHRAFRWPVLGGYALVAAAATVYLGSSLVLDDVVNERVAVARGSNTLVAAGRFESVRHSARGRAEIIEVAGGGRVLTLTGFEVDNGPDLRVYLVAGPAATEDDVDDVTDLGALKGNRGNQQYELPPDVDPARYSTVVIWCRAFSVLFARAPLAPS